MLSNQTATVITLRDFTKQDKYIYGSTIIIKDPARGFCQYFYFNYVSG